jgi:tetratricopeptide (TPR) repeat protein
MPHVHNGIGTWYAGKRNIATRKGSCTLCNAYGDMRSYDTTLYFVFLMVPLIPLKKVHVIDDCPSCRRHRTVKQKDWDRIKSEGIKKALDEVQDKPGDRETAIKAIGTAIGLQDGDAFLGLSALIEETSSDDPVVLAALAEGYDYFNHNPPAEAALRKAVTLHPSAPEHQAIREQLGHHLLMHGDPDEGFSFVSHILDGRDTKKTGTILLAVAAYRAVGRHADALSLLDRLEAAFPNAANDKQVKALRKSSTKLVASGKPVKVAYIHPKDAKGATERPWQTSLVKIIGPALAFIALAWYFGAAWWIGENRLIYVVSGVSKTYTAEIGGRGVSIPAFGYTRMRVPEGTLTIRVKGKNTHVPEATVRLESNFWSRPFLSPCVVVNPDRIALVEWEQTEYLPPNTPRVGSNGHRLHVGEIMHNFPDIEYPFEAFPREIQLSGNSGEKRRRIGIIPMDDPQERMRLVDLEYGPSAAHEFARRGVQADPDVGDYAEAAAMSDNKTLAIDTLRPLLADRPIRIPVHRAYQDLLRGDKPDELVAEYRDMLAKSPDDNSLKYLLARLEDGDREKANRLWRETISDPAAGPYSVGALAFDLLAEARFEDALAMLAKAPAGDVNAVRLEYLKTIALHGLGRFDDILKLPQFAQPVQEMGFPEIQQLMYFTQRAVTAAKGREEGRKAAEAILANVCAPYLSVPEQAETVKTLRAVYGAQIAYCDGDESVEIALAGGPNGGFIANLCKGDLAAAEKYADEARSLGESSVPLLLAIAATLQNDETLARQQFEKAAIGFEKSGIGRRACAGWFRGTATPSVADITTLAMETREKAITLVALGLKVPERREECFALARKLNFDRRAPYLLLARAMEAPAPKPK